LGDSFNAYDSNALGRYEYTIGWLKEWACTRKFGLGTYLPWDPAWVIESLSDSTIYMAYYTISNHLQGIDNLNGDSSKSPDQIDPKDLSPEVFDFIYLNKAFPDGCKISENKLKSMQDEFRYWYPMTLRISGKDLISNHLTMALFNHAAIWEDEPELWPRGYYCNGHVQVDAQKMSKSKGNFLMMNDTVEKYSADATRFACADAGDSLDDANFSRETADSAIVSLSNEEMWMVETLESSDLRTGDDFNFMDNVLINETNRLITSCDESFAAMQFREGLQKGWHEMLLARNEYRSWCNDSSISMHKTVVSKWIEALVILICPICPHWSENVWSKIGKEGLAVKASWPSADVEDKLLTRQAKFLRDALKRYRGNMGKAKKGWKSVSILVTNSYPEWKVNVLKHMQEQYSDDTGLPTTFMKDMKKWSGQNVIDKRMIKDTMQFSSFMRDEANEVGRVALDLELPFDQYAILEVSLTYLKSQLNLSDLDILDLSTVEDIPDRVAGNVSPGRPYLWIK